MTRRKTVRGLISLLTGSGTQLASNALAAMLATLWLPVNERGLMVIGLTLASLVSLFATFGIGNVYRSRHPRTWTENQAGLAKDFTLASAACVILGLMVGWTVAWASSFATDVALRSVPFLAAIALASAVQALQLLVTEARFAVGHFAAGSSWSAASAVAGLGGIYLAHTLGMSGSGYISLQSAAACIVLVAATVSALRVGAMALGRSTIRRIATLSIDGLRSMGLSIGIVIVSRADRLILATVTPPKVVAVYALAVTVSELLRLVPTAVAQLVTRRVAEGASWPIVVQYQKWTLLVSAFVALGVLGGSIWLVPIVFGSAYAEAPLLLAILLLAEMFYSLLVIASRALIGGEWSRFSTTVGLASVAFAVPVYLALSAVSGAIGCSVARVLTFGVSATAATLGVRRRLAE